MICSACDHMFRQPLIPQERYKDVFHGSLTIQRKITDVWTNVESCYICRAIYFAFPELPQDSADGYLHTISTLVIDNNSLQKFLLLHVTIGERRESITFNLYQGTSAEVGANHVESEWTGSKEAMQFASGCFRDCLANHKKCALPYLKARSLPTRLIEIESEHVDGVDIVISARIVVTSEANTPGHYATLSHCWGGTIPFWLFSENYESLRQEIDVSMLPLTFRDTLQVVVSLGLRYVWIDCLCIIQDSEEDWRHEALEMMHVYKNAAVNLAATKSVGAEGGLFAARHISSLGAEIELENPEARGLFQIVGNTYWLRIVDSATLNQRGWVLQERLLSPRILHFTAEQLIWDCVECVRTETLKDDVGAWPTDMQTTHKFQTPKRNFDLLVASDTEEFANDNDLWAMIVYAYSRSQLTYQKDKIIALAGIVNHLEGRLKDLYCAGIWAKHCAFQLAWYRNQGTRLGSRTNVIRAPSWSWLSVNGPVECSFRKMYDGYGLVELVDFSRCDVEQIQTSDGDVYTGSLLLRGAPTPLSVQEVDPSISFQIDAQIAQPFLNAQIRIIVQPDLPFSATEGGNFFFLPLFAVLDLAVLQPSYRQLCEFRGILLQSSIIQGVEATSRLEINHPKVVFRRIGHAFCSATLAAPFKGLSTYCTAIPSASRTNVDINGPPAVVSVADDANCIFGVDVTLI